MNIRFLPSPLKMFTKQELQQGEQQQDGGRGATIIAPEADNLIIDLTDSYTIDGVGGGGMGTREEEYWESWEWEWECIIPGGGKWEEEDEEKGKKCIYEGGKEITMPGRTEGRFQGEDGEKFIQGQPLFFVVRGRVMWGGGEGGGEGVADGRWSGLVNVVEGGEEGMGVKVGGDWWVCEDSSVGFLVIFFSLYFILVYLILF